MIDICMKEHISRFWKEYIVAVLLLGLAGVFINIDLSEFLKLISGNSIGPTSMITAVSFSYLFLVIVGPLVLISMVSYNYFHHRHATYHPDLHHSNDIHEVRHSSKDHEFHHFPHDNILNKFSSAETSNDETIIAKPLVTNETEQGSFDRDALLALPEHMDHIVLKQHLKTKMLQGLTREEIVQHLSDHDWDEEKIDKAFEELAFTEKETEIMLGTYVTRALIAGNHANSIRQALVEKGWQTKIVDKIINRVVADNAPTKLDTASRF